MLCVILCTERNHLSEIFLLSIHVLATVNILKFLTLFSFYSQLKCVFFSRAGINKMLVRIANREDTDQTARPFFAGV